jgi:hypothetical protein
MKIIKSEVMTDEDIKYFNTTKTMMRRVRTMLANLAERVEISDAKNKFKYAEDKVDNALSMLQIVDLYAQPANRNQLKMDFDG